MKKHWHMLKADPSIVKQLARELNCHPVTAMVLANRNILRASDAGDFLTVSLNHLRPPSSLIDMEPAVQRICTAITGSQKILIFGDYDVDGVTSTVILLDFLRYAGADVSYYIPHRINEGYSILPQHISHFVRPKKFNLIITADCGSGSHEAVEAAGRFGIDMVITDHHNIGSDLPAALAVVNPKRHDCPAGLQNLSGVGVAFYLLISLRAHLREKGFWQARPEPNLKNYCDLVALGTVADMVPLTRENRILCKTGLDLLNDGQRPGLAALLKVSGIRGNTLNAEDIAFRLAPRLNAAGRLDHASRAVDLLTARDVNFAAQASQTLNLLNQKRQELEKIILADIRSYLNINPSVLQRSSLVLSRDGWHAGVLGIVASRIMDEYYRPVVLIAVKDGIGKGSARSVPGIDLYAALAACRPYLENFGGHSKAAGMKIRQENIAGFQAAFENAVREMSKPEDLMPKLEIDGELDFSAISPDLINELESLIPFGTGNPEPLFISSNVKVISSKIVGRNHRRMILRQSTARHVAPMQAIHFNVDDRMSGQNSFEKMVFKLRWNRWNGKKAPQIIVEDLL
ncbi:MAG: single-stranded-DNA-specific exonuclease RecJ [Desulfobacterales bacterium]